MYRHESAYRALSAFNCNCPGAASYVYLRIPLDLCYYETDIPRRERDHAHTMVPNNEGPSFLVFRGYLPYVVTMPSQGELVGFRIYQQIE